MLNRTYANSDFERELEETKQKNLECKEEKIPLEKQLEKIVGMENVKEQLRKWNNYIEFAKKTKKKGINICDNYFHMIFEGNPGTGKTMIASVVANMLYSIGIIPTNKLVTLSAADIMKSRIGESTELLKHYIAKAYGGVLFIDEAYVWADKTYVTSSGGNSANECIIPLLTAMEEYKDNLVVIFAGYHEAMSDFLKINAGLESRIGYVIHFDDYDADELTSIYCLKAFEKGFKISENAILKLNYLMDYFSNIDNFGNGRFSEKVLTNTIIKKSQNKEDKDITVIHEKDIPSIKEMIEQGFSKHLLLPNALDKEEVRAVSLHELGHALMVYVSNDKEVQYITTIPRADGSLGGVCVKQKRVLNRNKNEIENDIIELLAGRACEEVLLGSVSDGCSQDVSGAKQEAKHMLDNYFFGFTSNNDVNSILDNCYKKAKEMINENKETILKVSKVLCKERTLTGKKLNRLFKKYGVKEVEYEH